MPSTAAAISVTSEGLIWLRHIVTFC